MYPFLKEKIVIVDGIDASGVYDLNLGKFYRVTKEAGIFFTELHGEKELNEYNPNEQEFVELAYCKNLIGFSEQPEFSINTSIDEVLIEKRSLKFAWIEITSICNQKCLHCFLGEELNKSWHQELASIKCSIDYMVAEGINQLIISGGEPLLHPQINELLKYCSNYSINLTLLTNGSINFEQNLLEIIRKNGIEVKIPLLGWKESHDTMTGIEHSFENTLKNIDILIKNGINVQIGCTVTSINYKDIHSIRKYVNEQKIKLEVSPLFEIGEAIKNKEVLFSVGQNTINEICKNDKKYIVENLRKIPKPERIINEKNDTDYKSFCLIENLTDSHECGQKIIALLSNGEVTPCLLLRDKKFSMGNLELNTLQEILSCESDRKREFDLMMKIKNIDTCNRCEARFACKGGGCIASSLALTGTINEKNPYYKKCYYNR